MNGVGAGVCVCVYANHKMRYILHFEQLLVNFNVFMSFLHIPTHQKETKPKYTYNIYDIITY